MPAHDPRKTRVIEGSNPLHAERSAPPQQQQQWPGQPQQQWPSQPQQAQWTPPSGDGSGPIVMDRPAAPAPAPAGDEPSSWRACPFCAEMIRAAAIKCRHCGEFLNKPPGA